MESYKLANEIKKELIKESVKHYLNFSEIEEYTHTKVYFLDNHKYGREILHTLDKLDYKFAPELTEEEIKISKKDFEETIKNINNCNWFTRIFKTK